MEISVHNPDEDDQDDTHAEWNLIFGDAGFEALVLNLSTICFKSIPTNYKTILL